MNSSLAPTASSRFLRHSLTAIFGFALIGLNFGFQQSVAAEDSVLRAVQEAVEQMTPMLKAKGITRVHVGGFTSPKGTSTGAEVQEKMLRVITTEHKDLLQSKLDYQVVIRGRLEKLENPLGVRIVCQLFNANETPLQEVAGEANEGEANEGEANEGEANEGKTNEGKTNEGKTLPVEGKLKPLEFTQLIDGTEAIARINGVTAESTAIGRDKQLEEFEEILAKEDPSVIENNIVKASATSPYGVEILLMEQKEKFVSVAPLKVEAIRGCTFVNVPDGARYIIRLHNFSEKTVSALVTIDGLSTMVFSKMRKPDTRYAIPKNSFGDVRGWDYDNESSFGFKKVAGYPGSAMEDLLVTNESMGQICVQFSEFFSPGDPMGRGTAVGEMVSDKKVEVQGSIGDLRSTIVIRYER